MIRSPCFFLFTSFLVIGWIWQTQLLLNWDVSWDLLVTERLLQGGTYTHDFFDLNPPLIFFVMTPAVLLAKIFAINNILALRIYFFILILLSLWMCYGFIRRIFIKESALFSYTMLSILAFIFLILPGMDFGEREHLLIIFTFPYFLMLACRLENIQISNRLAISIGIFSCLGFALKPHFLMAFIFAELVAIFYTHKLLFWLRTEVITIMILLIVYLCIIIMLYPDYLSTVVPLAKRFYYAGFHDDWSLVLYNDLIYFYGIVLLFYFIQYKDIPYKKLSNILLLVMFGFFLSYLLQRNSWPYHAYPATAVALFITSVWFGLIIKNNAQNTLKLVALAVVFFTLPMSYFEGKYLIDKEFKPSQQVLNSFLNTLANHKAVYFITASPREIFPTIMNSGAIYSSRLLHLFWIPAIVKNKEMLSSQAAKKDEETFMKMVAEDIDNNKPELIFVDVNEHKRFFTTYSFDYLPYLLKNQHFQNSFRNYQYFTKIKAEPIRFKPEDWSIYWVKFKDAIPPKEIEGNAVILTKYKKGQMAYYLKNHQFMKRDHRLLQTPIQLTKNELSMMPIPEGKVKITQENKAIIEALIYRLAFFPAYQYQVYVRKK